VNRVWRWHFGSGLVRTIDNLGLLGDKPSHPELLDWLNQRLLDRGWSLKAIHRLILSSSTYQQSSKPQPETTTRDPENRLFSRANVRRLEGEEVRDAFLAVSDKIDTTIGGSLLKVKNRGYFFDHTSKDLTDYNSHRRTLYLPVVRNNVYDVMQLLDFPDPAIPSGDRATTTIAPQALLMLNSDLVMQAANDLASRLSDQNDSVEQQIDNLYKISLGRPPTAAEAASGIAFVQSAERALIKTKTDAESRRIQAWAVLCQTVLAANEFIYIQ
jgi:hypothetical protein